MFEGGLGGFGAPELCWIPWARCCRREQEAPMKTQFSSLQAARPVPRGERDLLCASQLWGVLQIHSWSWHVLPFVLIFVSFPLGLGERINADKLFEGEAEAAGVWRAPPHSSGCQERLLEQIRLALENFPGVRWQGGDGQQAGVGPWERHRFWLCVPQQRVLLAAASSRCPRLPTAPTRVLEQIPDPSPELREWPRCPAAPGLTPGLGGRCSAAGPAPGSAPLPLRLPVPLPLRVLLRFHSRSHSWFCSGSAPGPGAAATPGPAPVPLRVPLLVLLRFRSGSRCCCRSGRPGEAMGSGRRRLLLPALLLLPLLPAAWALAEAPLNAVYFATGDCGPLPNISHAEPLEDTKHRESFTVGSKVRYRCLTGFVKRPLMSETIQCLANSQWSHLPEFCGRSCPSPPRVHFAKVSQEHETQNFYPVAVTVKYICRPGYESSTDQLPTSTCLEDLTWSEVPELCQTISCPPPPTIPNGQHNGNGTEEFAYNSVVMYTCDPGLQLVGNETLLCTTENSIDGVWSRSPPECRGSATAATNQTEPLEERTPNNLHWLVGVILMCIVAAVIVGVIAALLINRWKDNKQRSDKACLPEHEVNGRDLPMHPKIMDDGKQPVLWHSYFCSPAEVADALRAEGAGEAVSDAEQLMDHESSHICPICEDWLRAHDDQHGTHHVAPTREQQDRGINADGCSILKLVRGKGKSCGPPNIMNGYFEYTTNLSLGATINITCNVGYRLIGKPSVQCILRGNEVFWDDIPHCAIIPCLPPPAIENGQLNSGNRDFTYGMAAIYSCNNGFDLIGNNTIHCTTDDNLNGIWSGPAPECKVVRCENPAVKNGKRLSGFGLEHKYKSTVTFECNSGYFLNGSSVVTCEADNTWKPPLPTCDPVCGPAPQFPFAELSSAVGDSSPAGTELSYRCKPGYTVAQGKSSVVTCLSDTTWSADPDFCIRQQCARPNIENGDVNADSFPFETVVTFTCHPGYELKVPSAKCVVSGNGVDWDPASPYCERRLQDVLCEEPPTIASGTHNGTKGTDFVQGSTIAYKCNHGFTLVGEPFLRCIARDQYQGAWNNPAPECRGGANMIIVGGAVHPKPSSAPGRLKVMLREGKQDFGLSYQATVAVMLHPKRVFIKPQP
ncbi:hypothetical protein Q9966_012839 [Columba livia]|nr:hypothetical protein Q9966_012839 [Columba livia]